MAKKGKGKFPDFLKKGKKDSKDCKCSCHGKSMVKKAKK